MEALLSAPLRYTAFVMPKASKLKLLPLPESDETPGRRLARIPMERGFTRFELGEQTGMLKTLIFYHERGKLRLNADTILRFAMLLGVFTEALLQAAGPAESRKPSWKVLRRLEQIEGLRGSRQTTLLCTIDTFLKRAAIR